MRIDTLSLDTVTQLTSRREQTLTFQVSIDWACGLAPRLSASQLAASARMSASGRGGGMQRGRVRARERE